MTKIVFSDVKFDMAPIKKIYEFNGKQVKKSQYYDLLKKERIKEAEKR